MVNPVINECPECHADQDVLQQSLMENGQNYILAEAMVKSCKGCMRRLGHHLKEARIQVLTLEEFAKMDKLPDGKKLRIGEK
uniref:Uncharacterized protein n=1 Tax=viral metagenome TaxID=1070528 RepID=A0A6M3Y317_9ZZZZ